MLSCILPSKPSRFALAQRAIMDFVGMLRESPGRKAELLVATGNEEYAARLRGFVSSVKAAPEVHVLWGKFSRIPFDCLGHALTQAVGDYVSLWDEADKHSKRWLEYASLWIDTYPNCVIVPTKTLYHFYETKETYVCDFYNTRRLLKDNATTSNVLYPRRALPMIHMTVRNDPYVKIFSETVKTAQPVFPDALADRTSWLHMAGVAEDVKSERHDRHRAKVQGQFGILTRQDVAGQTEELLKDLKGFYGDVGHDLDIQSKDGHVFKFDYEAKDSLYPGRLMPLPDYAVPDKESETDGEAQEDDQE